MKDIDHNYNSKQKNKDLDFDIILAKITFSVPNRISLTLGRSKIETDKYGNWLVVSLSEKKHFTNLNLALKFYIQQREYLEKKYDTINFEGFDDETIRDMYNSNKILLVVQAQNLEIKKSNSYI